MNWPAFSAVLGIVVAVSVIGVLAGNPWFTSPASFVLGLGFALAVAAAVGVSERRR